MTYKKLNTKEPVDLIPYIKEYLSTNPETLILIGSDSQNHRRETTYAVVVGLYKPKKGAHVLYNKFDVPRIKDNFTRLFGEVQYSVEIAEKIRLELGIRAQYIDIDINSKSKYKSSEVLASAVGFVSSYGYRSRHKNEGPMLTYAADSLIKR